MIRSWFWGGTHCFVTYPLSIAILISTYFFLHAFAAGVNIPYPDPTHEQAAMEKFHQPILLCLFLVAAIAWMLAALGVLIWLTRYSLSRLK